MKPVNPGVKLTYDDYVHFPDDGLRHELIDGEHYVTPTPIRKHQAICGNLLGMIWSYLRSSPSAASLLRRSTSSFRISTWSSPISCSSRTSAWARSPTSPWVKGAPSLVVEIGSPGTRKRDATIKRRLYERVGVDEYWIIDPELDTVDVYRLIEGRYHRIAQLSLEAGDVLTTACFRA